MLQQVAPVCCTHGLWRTDTCGRCSSYPTRYGTPSNSSLFPTPLTAHHKRCTSCESQLWGCSLSPSLSLSLSLSLLSLFRCLLSLLRMAFFEFSVSIIAEFSSNLALKDRCSSSLSMYPPPSSPPPPPSTSPLPPAAGSGSC